LHIVRAKELYRSLVGVPFAYEHCWNLLKNCPKWSTNNEKIRKRSFGNASSPSTQGLINLGKDNLSTSNFVYLERPEGRKAAKERLNKKNSNDNNDDIVVGLLTQMNERAMIANERKLQLWKKRVLKRILGFNLRERRFELRQRGFKLNKLSYE
jgi:hypothetical protein